MHRHKASKTVAMAVSAHGAAEVFSPPSISPGGKMQLAIRADGSTGAMNDDAMLDDDAPALSLVQTSAAMHRHKASKSVAMAVSPHGAAEVFSPPSISPGGKMQLAFRADGSTEAMDGDAAFDDDVPALSLVQTSAAMHSHKASKTVAMAVSAHGAAEMFS